MNPNGGMRGMRGPMRSFARDKSVTTHKIAPGIRGRIFRFAAPYKKLLSVFLVVVVLDAAVGAANPLILRQIINKGILGHDSSLIIALAFLVAGLALLDAGFAFASRVISARIGEGLIFAMRTQIFAHIQRMPLAFFTRTQTGSLVSRLNNDVLGAQEAFTDVLSNVVGNIISVLLVLIAMLFLSWQLTLAAIVILPIFLFPARWLGRRLHDITLESYNLNATMNNTMIERFNVSGALLTKIFGNPAREESVFQQRAARVRDIGITQAMYARFLFIALMLTASLATALIYGWGGLLAVQGALNVGTVVALTAYLSRLYGPLTQLSNMNVDIMTALVSFERVFEVLDIKPLVEEKPNAASIAQGPASIEFDNVDFSYPSAKQVSLASLEDVATLSTVRPKPVLSGISFKGRPGELVALVGPSGAGKTTISQLVGRLYDTSAGSVRINGTDVRDATFESLRSRIGMVTQDAHLFHETIRDNLLFARPDATDAEIGDALKSAQLQDLIAALPEGLDTMVGERGYRLSGGEKQRLAIARVLLKAPDIVILDEATAHLDSESERAIQEALETTLAGRTSLVIAHRLSTVRSANQILVLDHGRIVEHGTHDALIKRGGLYSELYKTQFKS
ncbi:MAG TPA: ABC transporter ATP-binding protein [Candidatus Saccharimonadia bacterium]|nr:ABC transporter ATP-binding protein [Candidatus Saccharimonadia bacterium]